MQELRANAVIQAHRLGHHLDVRADPLAEVRHFIDEGDLGRQEGVGGVFDHLGRGDVREDEGGFDQVEGAVEVAHDRFRLGTVGADDDTVRPHEVFHGRSFTEEFGVGHDVKAGGRRGMPRNQVTQPLPGSHRHRRFGDDHLVAVQVGRDAPSDVFDEREVRRAVVPGRRAHGDENREACFDGLAQVSGEDQPAFRQSFANQFGQTGFVDRNVALFQQGDAALVLVHAGHLDAEFREAGPGHQSDVPGPNDADVHASSSSCGQAATVRGSIAQPPSP